MEEKLYETYAKEIVESVHNHATKAKEIADTYQKVTIDRRYSEFGKNEILNRLRNDLKELNKNVTDEIKETVTKFCNEYQMKKVKNEKADSQDVANALKIIDMCGFNLTPELMKNAIEPLKDSYDALKMIESLLMTKEKNIGGLYFDLEVKDVLHEYMGVNGGLYDYERVFSLVSEVLNHPELVSAGIQGFPEYNGTVVNRLVDNTPYTTMCLADNMMNVGKMYDVLSLEYPGMFK